MTHNDTTNTGAGGNTLVPARVRGFTLTINNYEDDIFDTLTQVVSLPNQYVFGKEIGEEKGTPHIQGYIKWKNARTFASMKKMFPTAHIEKAKGTPKQNYTYCTKDGDFITNMDYRTFREKLKDQVLEEEYKDVRWKPFQQKIIETLDKKPDKRKIHWYWEEEGKMGKSYLCKWLAIKKKVILASGKRNDVFNQVNKSMEKEIAPEIILIDLPRDDADFFNFGGLEQLKNGCIYSGKYEGDVCIFPIPHVFIFANHEPEEKRLSADRWDITEISEDISVHTEEINLPRLSTRANNIE